MAGNTGAITKGKKNNPGRVATVLFTTAGFLTPAIAWEFLSRSGYFDSVFIPPFSVSLFGALRLAELGLLFDSLVISLWRAFMGLCIAFLTGVPLGLCAGRLAGGAAFNPLFRLLAQVNPFTVMPLFILFFGIGEISKIAVCFWVSLWPVCFNTFAGARCVDQTLVKTAKTMAASPLRIFFTVILPGASSLLFDGLKLGLEMAFFVLVAAEMIGASAGLGWLVQASYYNLQFPWMYGAAIVTVVTGLSLSLCLGGIRKKLFFWREDKNTEKEKFPSRKKGFSKPDICIFVFVFLVIFCAGILKNREIRKENENFGKEGFRSAPLGIFDE
jgi:NitT/TauT family transport system permease protein